MSKIKEFIKLTFFILRDKSGHLDIKIPKDVLEAIARCFLPDIIAFFESEEGRKEFEKWKRQQESNGAKSQSKGA